MIVGFTTSYAISSYATNVVGSNPAQARCTQYNTVIKFISDLRQVGGFLRLLLLTDHHDIAELLLEVALSAITQTPLLE